MSLDINPILGDWPYLPDDITVRVIEGDDGKRKIQLRLDLGVLQMEFDGRPDGRQIHDADSWLAYHQRNQRDHDAAHPDGAPYRLESEDCAELLREGVQYYHRYVCFWHLGFYELCARDTERNLRLFAFVREHARHDRDKLRFDQWRPYVTMMHARAVATPLVELEQWDAAAGVLDAGIRGIERFLEEYNQVEQASKVGELVFLRRWKEEIAAKIKAGDGDPTETAESAATESTAVEAAKPVDRAAELRVQIEQAIVEERYEEAALLRDELRRLEPPPASEGEGVWAIMTNQVFEFADKRDELLRLFASYGSCAVAFSGGVDSAVVAKAARLALGDAAVLVTGDSDALAAGELDAARELAVLIGARHVIVRTEEFANPDYVANRADRCYHCKTELYEQISDLAARLGVNVVVNGANADDLGDYRPGMRAAAEHEVRSPLAECGFTKREVRELAAEWELPVAEKPATPCLSSRVAYGQEVTPERLAMIDRAEQLLRSLGLRELRVRYHEGDMARLEVPLDELAGLCDPTVREVIVDELRRLGFKFVTLDLAGFRSGGLNQLIAPDELRRFS